MPKSRRTYERINPAEWAPVRGKGGNAAWVNRETGERISNRQYRNRLVGESIEAYRARPERVQSRLARSEFHKVTGPQADAAYRDFTKYWRSRYPNRPLPSRFSTDFQDILDDLASKSTAPSGRKARALKKLGRRKPGWDFPVGATPK